MKIFIGQINTTVGALDANAEMIRRIYGEGVRAGADIVMVPELAVTGYPPLDLIDKPVFVEKAQALRDALAAMTGPTALLFGCVTSSEKWCGKPVRNTAVLAREGRII